MNDSEHQFNKSKGLIESIREINHKYRTPRIKMTPMVNIMLWALRIYLLVVLMILVYKFVTLIVR
jgi:biopolymer transport protein ExbD